MIDCLADQGERPWIRLGAKYWGALYLNPEQPFIETVTELQKNALRAMGRKDFWDGEVTCSTKPYMMGFGGGKNPRLEELRELEHSIRAEIKTMSIPLKGHDATPQSLAAYLENPLLLPLGQDSFEAPSP